MEDEGNDVMAKRIVELEVECEHLKDENVKLETEVKWVKEKKKEKSAKLKETINSKERKWKEENEKITEKYMKLEVQKRKLEIDLKASVNKRATGDDALIKLRTTENVIQFQNKSMQEKDDEIKSLVKKQKLGEEKNLELNQRVEAMEKMMSLEVKKNAMEAEKRLREVEGIFSDLVKRVEASQKAKKAMQEKVLDQKKMNEEIKKIVFEKMESEEERKKEDMVLFGRIESLELEKKEMEDKAVEMRAEIDKRKTAAQAYMMAFEDRKKEILVLFGCIESLEEEKKDMEGKIKEMKAEKIAFEKEKREMEAKLSWLNRALKEKEEEMCRDCNDKDEVIQFLRKENETLEAQKKEHQIEKLRLAVKRERDEPYSCSQNKGRRLRGHLS